MNFLIIDDEPDCVFMAKHALAREFENCTVRQAVRCSDGIQLLSVETFDAAIIDQRLIGESGIDCLKSIRSRWKHLPVVMITGYGRMPDIVKETFKEDADDFVSKQNFADLLGHSVWAAIQRRRRFMEIDQQAAAREAALDTIKTKIQNSD